MTEIAVGSLSSGCGRSTADCAGARRQWRRSLAQRRESEGSPRAAFSPYRTMEILIAALAFTFAAAIATIIFLALPQS
jgi:hypothetical protein